MKKRVLLCLLIGVLLTACDSNTSVSLVDSSTSLSANSLADTSLSAPSQSNTMLATPVGTEELGVVFPSAPDLNTVLYPAILDKDAMLDVCMGYVDKQGEIIVGPEYLTAGFFNEGYGKAANKEGTVYINGTGTPQFGRVFDGGTDFSEGKAVVYIGDGIYLLDTISKTVLQFDPSRFIFSNTGFSNGLLCVEVKVPNSKPLYGYMDETGQLVIEPQYAYATDFKEGLALVHTPDGNMQYIDTSGTVIVDLGQVAFDPINTDYQNHYFSEGIAYTPLGHYIDKNGQVLEMKGNGAFQDGIAPYTTDGTLWGFVDREGTVVLDPQYRQVGHFCEGLAAVYTDVGTDTMVGFIDHDGIVVIEPVFYLTYSASYGYLANYEFHDGVAGVFTAPDDNASYALCSRDGALVYKPA